MSTYSTEALRGTAPTRFALFGQSNAEGDTGANPEPTKTVEGRLWEDGTEVATYGTLLTVGVETLLAPHRKGIKRGVGASPIADWNSTYLALLFADAVAAGFDPEVCIVIQGEADAKTAPLAAAWPAAATVMFDACIAEWGPQLFIVPLLSGLPPGTYPEMAAWNAGLVAFASGRPTADTVVVPTADLEKQGDNIHYNRRGYDALARRIRAVLVSRGL